MAEETSCQVWPLFCCNIGGYVDPVYRNGMLLDSLHWRQVVLVLWSLLMIRDALVVRQTCPQLLRLYRVGQVFLHDHKWGDEDVPWWYDRSSSISDTAISP